MRQHRQFKEQNPGCILFFRMGDFYELFYEDAEIAHRVLGITLTQRSSGIPMAGMPFHSVDGYLRRMIQAGYRVAVCDQVEDPKEAKGVVKRDVTRVITPGTLVDESLLEEGRQNPLAAIWPVGDGKTACAWADLSTGACAVATFENQNLLDELARIQPSELLYAETDTGDEPPAVAQAKDALNCAPASRPGWQFRQAEAVEVLCRQYGVKHLAGFGFEDNDPVLIPIAAVIQYLLETQRTGPDGRLAHIRPPKAFVRQEHLIVDRASLAALEVERTQRSGGYEGSLLQVMQQGGGCATAMGKRSLRQWLCYPLCDQGAIETRQGVVATLVDGSRLRDELRDTLSGIQDVERICSRLSVGRASPRDLVALGTSATQASALDALIQDVPALVPMADRLAAVRETLQTLGQTITTQCKPDAPAHLREGGLIQDGIDAELDECRGLKQDGAQWLAEYQARLLAETGIPQMKVGYNKVFGYYIELTAVNRDKAPANWVRKQTLKNAERFITDELKQYEEKVLSADARAITREQLLFDWLCDAAREALPAWRELADVVAELDVLGCFAKQAARGGFVRPAIVDEPVLDVVQGRHPVLDRLLGDKFVPNDLQLGDPRKEDMPSLALITGPNMAGKSTYIRQAALITLLAHTGSFVPAESATVGLTDRIFTRIGSSDELHTGQSTFMVEMTETANLCHQATERSLVVLDEIGRGTSTLDGLSLAWAITEHLAARGCRCLFATHYHELTQLAEQLPGVGNLHVKVREWQDDVVFLHQIVSGATNRSYGIHVAKIAGLPDSLIARANELLAQLAVSHEGDGAPKVAAAAKAVKESDSQMGLFTEYVEHPVVASLREMDLLNLTPMQAFDELRKLKNELI